MRCLTNAEHVVTQQYATIAAGASETLVFRADSGPILFDRILIGAPAAVLDVLQVTRAQINGELQVLGRCHAKALNRLFRLSRLSRPFHIAGNNTLTVELSNPSAADAVVNVKLMPAPVDPSTMTARHAQPRILTIFAELDADAQAVELRAESYPTALAVPRFVVAADDEDALRYTLRLQQQILRREEYPAQTLAEMEGFRLFAPIRLPQRERLTFDLTNDSAEENAFSFVAEAQSAHALTVGDGRQPSAEYLPAYSPVRPSGGYADLPLCDDQTVETTKYPVKPEPDDGGAAPVKPAPDSAGYATLGRPFRF